MRAPVFPGQAGCVRRRALNAGIVGGALAAGLRCGVAQETHQGQVGSWGALAAPSLQLEGARGLRACPCVSVGVCTRSGTMRGVYYRGFSVRWVCTGTLGSGSFSFFLAVKPHNLVFYAM